MGRSRRVCSESECELQSVDRQHRAVGSSQHILGDAAWMCISQKDLSRAPIMIRSARTLSAACSMPSAGWVPAAVHSGVHQSYASGGIRPASWSRNSSSETPSDRLVWSVPLFAPVTWQIHRCAPVWCANPSASRPALFEASEKSVAYRMVSNRRGGSFGGFALGPTARTGASALRIRCSAVDPSRKRSRWDFDSVPTTISSGPSCISRSRSASGTGHSRDSE